MKLRNRKTNEHDRRFMEGKTENDNTETSIAISGRETPITGQQPIDVYGNIIPTDHLVWNIKKGKWVHPNGFAPNPYTNFEDIFSSTIGMKENVYEGFKQISSRKLPSTEDLVSVETFLEEPEIFSQTSFDYMLKYLVEGSKEYDKDEIARENLELALDNLERNAVAMNNVISKIGRDDAESVISMLNDDVYGYSTLNKSSEMVKILQEKYHTNFDTKDKLDKKDPEASRKTDIQALVEMGFGAKTARNALDKTGWSGVENATNWILFGDSENGNEN